MTTFFYEQNAINHTVTVDRVNRAATDISHDIDQRKLKFWCYLMRLGSFDMLLTEENAMRIPKPWKQILLTAAIAFFSMSSVVHAANVGGFDYEDSMKLGGKDLHLNGGGVRYKAVFAVYSAGLYLTSKKTSVPDILADQGPKRVRLVLQRQLSSEDLAQAFMTGLQKNTERADRSRIVNDMLKFGQLFASIPEAKKGDVITVDYIPGTGTVVSLNGKMMGEAMKEPFFYTALLKIWLGDQPADTRLKKAWLGETEEQRQLNN